MADNHAVEDEKGSLDVITLVAPLAVIPTLSPQFLNTAGPNFNGGTDTESKAISMASNEFNSAQSSPAEASPAKPAETSTTLDDAAETSTATSCAASGSDSLTCRGTSLVNIPENSPSLSVMPSAKLCSPDLDKDFPAVLTFKGVSVTLENSSVWKEFYSYGTEMILTKQGRRMFPYCQYKISGLDPDRKYSLVLSIVPWGQHRYRWHMNKWEVHGPSGYTSKGLIRAYSHHYSPCQGSEWMSNLVSFDKLKLSNNQQSLDGHIVLNSMHRYIPNLHVIPVLEADQPTPEQPVVMGTESMTFTFPQTEFVGVTCYQNFKIIQLKISHNPFAKGFREDGSNPRLQRQSKDAKPATKPNAQAGIPDQPEKKEDGVVVLSTKKDEAPVSKSNRKEVKLVLKPFMSNSANKYAPYYSCARGKRALCDLMLVEKQPLVEPKEEEMDLSVSPDMQQDSNATSSTSTPTSSPRYRKRGRKSNKGRQNTRGRHWKTAAASSSVAESPSLTVFTQPELDDVEGLLFASFTSKEALEVHVREMPPSAPSAASPVAPATATQSNITIEVEPEAEEETITRLELALEKDLKALKHRQVIHPVLQEVGLKLSSLHPTKPIDLQYLGVCLPLPPPNPSHHTVSSPADEGLPFISRNGKTSDVTKIKGWKTKYIGSKDVSPSNCEGSQKNLSAFCSNMLDEYLENEALQISERAAAFSSNPESSVAYQLPEKSSSYIKTLDSALKHRNTASKLPKESPRPCPLSHKSHLYAALTSPPPLLPSTATPRKTKPPTTSKSALSSTNPATHSSPSTTNNDSQKASTCSQGLTQKPLAGLGRGRGRGTSQKLLDLTKAQLRLLQMEKFALNQGLSRTQLTPERVSMSLSAVLTKETMFNQVSNTTRFTMDTTESPECGRDHCRLGCVCSSLQQQNKEHFHCRRPECMFGCTCLKHKITKQTIEGESEEQGLPLYSVSNMQHAAQLCPDSLASKLWNRNINDEDPEPLFTPECPKCSVFSLSESDPKPMVQEEDEGPVDEGFESMMCARVRGINSQPPPQVALEPKSVATPPSNTVTHLQDTTDNLGKNENDTVLPAKKAERTSQEFSFNDKEAKRQIQIHSRCRWEKDRRWVTKALCDHINKKRFSKRFYIGPYCISPVAKIFMRKSSGTTITYKVQICKKSQSSDTEEDDSDYSNEELEEGQVEQSSTLLGVTPFLRGVIPAGRLTARRKPAGCRAQGLVQVNGKFYNHAKVMLGNIGSLHPTNRLAAYISGRLQAPSKFKEFYSQKLDSTQKPNDCGSLSIKAAGSVVPQVITARKTTDLKTPVHILETDLCRKGSDTGPQSSDCSSTSNSAQLLVSSQNRISESLQSRTPFSPVSLTVSPSLKNPSFLEQSGTCSFRICPPSSQGQNLDGVSLPGGFYLIQLPKSEADKPTQQTEPSSGANKATTSDLSLEKNGAINQLAADWFGMNAFDKIRSLFGNNAANPDSSSDPNHNEKLPSDENDESNNYQAIKQEESNPDDVSEYVSSSFSDYSGDFDEDDEYVEVETVEEREEMEIAQWRETAFEKLQQTRNFSNDFTSREFRDQDQIDDGDGSIDNRRRFHHLTLERQRRVKQRDLFKQLELALQLDPPNSRLNILTQAQKEIESLVEISKLLEKKRTMLIALQSVYLKKLCSLSGKSEKDIRKKLMEICKKLKMKEDQQKWNPDLLKHLRLRAALLQATTAQPSLQPSPLVEHGYATPSQDELLIIPAHNQIQKILSLLQPPQDKLKLESFGNASHPERPPLPQAEKIAPSIQVKTEPEEAVDSLQGRRCLSELVDKWKETGTSHRVKAPDSQADPHNTIVKVKSEDSAVQDGDLPASSKPSRDFSKELPPKPINLPLIRSKTGRIILPSCLKPLGDGYYTLTLMKSKNDIDGGEVSSPANAQLSPVDTSTKTERNDSEADQPSPSETSCDLEGKTESSDVDSKVVEFPMAEFNLPNHSIYVPSMEPKVLGKSQEGGAEEGVRKTLAALRLAFNRKKRPPGSADSKVRLFQCHKGRPAKIAAKPTYEDKKDLVATETNKVNDSTVPQQVEEEPEKTVMNTEEEVEKTPLPAKRHCGRPKSDKVKQLPSRQGPGKRAASCPSKSDKDNSISYPRRVTGSATTAQRVQRPLTRGALGKDFPSAKKRSWIDVERELEPEFDYE